MSALAIILARGGSKRIPRKNLKPFLGYPIIKYSIDAAISSELFDEVMVSTDDDEIKELSLKYGAKVPFLRSPQASDDFATTADALVEVISLYAEQGKIFDYTCCLYPTAPFVTSEKLVYAYKILINNKYKSVFPVLSFHYPIWRSFILNSGRLVMNFSQYENSRSQDLPQTFHDAGQFYFFNTEVFMMEKTLFTNNSFGIKIDEFEGQDIDTLEDWKLAEIKYKMRKNGKI